MPDITCFFLQRTNQVDRKLRRYVSPSDHIEIPACPLIPGQYSYHDATIDLGVVEEGDGAATNDSGWPKDDPRWPTHCKCGFVFPADATKQLFCEHLYRRVDTGQLMTLRAAPPGAMWYADWMIERMDRAKHGNLYLGPDGHCLVVKCPDGHEWMVDSRANNCTRTDDNIHKCWVRHGTPPLITVDKNGDTCSAGAGSILTSKWHGFLTNGVLSERR